MVGRTWWTRAELACLSCLNWVGAKVRAITKINGMLNRVYVHAEESRATFQGCGEVADMRERIGGRAPGGGRGGGAQGHTHGRVGTHR